MCCLIISVFQYSDAKRMRPIRCPPIFIFNLGKTEARRLIMGTVYTYMLEVEDTDPPSMAEYADEHSTSEQRRFNLLCMAYGSDPELFEDVAAWGGLPEERADICEEEFYHIGRTHIIR